MHSSEMAKISEGPYVLPIVEELCALTIQEIKDWANEGYRNCKVTIANPGVLKYLQDKKYSVTKLHGNVYQVSW